MISSISSRGTWYDITGYIMPGFVAEGVLWLTAYTLGFAERSIAFARVVWTDGGFLCATVFVAFAYVLGHMVNSISSAVIEKWLCSKRFKDAADWYNRIKKEGGPRAVEIESRVEKLFHIKADELETFDVLARAVEYLPRAFISGFSFLSFYGMCRSLSLLCFLALPSVFIISFKGCTCACEHQLVCKIVVGLLACIPVLISAIAFGNQYLRFVKYYADYLASTLLCKGENEPLLSATP